MLRTKMREIVSILRGGSLKKLVHEYRYDRKKLFRGIIYRPELVIPYLKLLTRDYRDLRAYFMVSLGDECITLDLEKPNYKKLSDLDIDEIKKLSANELARLEEGVEYRGDLEHRVKGIYFSKIEDLPAKENVEIRRRFVNFQLFSLFELDKTPKHTPIVIRGYNYAPWKFMKCYLDVGNMTVNNFINSFSNYCEEMKENRLNL